jgi:polar amino acid transport system substrate-binding protein
MHIFTITLILVLTIAHTAIAGETYKIVVDDWVPYSFIKDGKKMGTDIDLLNAVGKKIGVEFEFVFVPWSRAIHMVKVGDADGIISLYDTPERRDFLLYTKEAISTETIILITSYNNKLKSIHSFKDLAGLSIGITPDTSYGKEFDSLNNYIKEPCRSTDIKIAKLIGNRMDVAVINQASFRERSKHNPTLKSEIKTLPLIINKQNLFLAFSKKANERKNYPINKISDAIRTLRNDGAITTINKVYMNY